MNFTILPQKEKKQATQQDYRMLSYVLAFLIPLMTLLVIMQYFGFAPFGEKNLFVSQGAFYNMTILTDTIHSIRNGSFHRTGILFHICLLSVQPIYSDLSPVPTECGSFFIICFYDSAYQCICSDLYVLSVSQGARLSL